MAPEISSILKPRFKGIENFLRKIAFNLGNTPSQTEVKIISCIPIDVTDLQNKIVDLERELDATGNRTPSDEQMRGRMKAHVAVGAPEFTPSPLFNSDLNEPIASPSPSLHPEPPSRVSLSEIESTKLPEPKSHDSQNNRESYVDATEKVKKCPKIKIDKKKRGRTQMVYFAQTMYPKKMCEEGARQSKRLAIDDEQLSRTYLTDVVQRQYRPELIGMEPSSSSRFSWPVCRDEPSGTGAALQLDSDVCSCCHGLFHNTDTTQDTTDSGQHRDYSVYYDSSLYDVVPVRERSSRLVMDNSIYQKGQNDVFLKLEDDYFLKSMTPRVQFHQPNITKYCMVTTPYRSHYKVRCKKKLPNKATLKREQVIRAMQNRKQNHELLEELSCSGSVDCGSVYTKPYNPTPRVVVCPSMAPPKQPLPHPSYPSSPPPELKNAECLTVDLDVKELQPATNRSVQLEPASPQEDTKTEITLNQIKNILHAVLTEVKTSAPAKNVVLDNKPTTTKDAIVQNGPSRCNIATDSSFLNSYLFSPQYSFGPYGPSYSGQMGESQAFYQTGSTMAPQGAYGTNLGTQIGQPGPSPCADAAKCVQNYPLFIHTQGQRCSCCYRNASQPTQPTASPAPAPTNSNTEPNRKPSHSKETNNLIKEIYKSLALNTSYPQKDSVSHYTNSTNLSHKFEFKVLPKSKAAVVASEILPSREKQSMFLKKGEMFGSAAASYRSEVKTMTAASGLDTDSATARGDGVCSLLPAKRALGSTGSESPVEHERRFPVERERSYGSTREYGYRDNREYSPPNKRGFAANQKRGYATPRERTKYTVPALPSSASDEDTATPSIEDTEPSETTVIETEKKEKKGLFSRMKKLFSSRPRRRRKKDDSSSSENEQELASDSDDYETIYSEHTTRSGKSAKNRPATPPPAARRRRPHTKASHSHYPDRDSLSPRSPRRRFETPAPPHARRSPYMDQEYRRHWTEDLTFQQDRPPRLSSERPARSGRQPGYGPPAHCSPHPPFWQQYEARHAFVPQPHHVPPLRPPFAPPLRAAYAPPLRAPYAPPLRAAYAPPLRAPCAPPLRPPCTPQYCPYQPTQGQVNQCGLDEMASMNRPPAAGLPGRRPVAYKPAASGLAWVRRLNAGFPQCGVQWKKFFLDA